ncbi:uncharacterized protein [Drosophila bipectinata]|uniref:uncharacterized protein n=1 Tax=Drosophila bipectinata TaxID=42026 RepID=UPI0038B3574E
MGRNQINCNFTFGERAGEMAYKPIKSLAGSQNRFIDSASWLTDLAWPGLAWLERKVHLLMLQLTHGLIAAGNVPDTKTNRADNDGVIRNALGDLGTLGDPDPDFDSDCDCHSDCKTWAST